eukprot:gene5404-21465_t
MRTHHSELGVDGPQRRVYQVGFGSVGVLLALSVRLHQRRAMSKPHLLAAAPHSRAMVEELRTEGYKAAAGVALQGVCTLQHQLSLQSFAHWGGAVLFVMGASAHAAQAKK